MNKPHPQAALLHAITDGEQDMTEQDHLEVSRKLAEAIGWKPEQMFTFELGSNCWLMVLHKGCRRTFDYRDREIAFRVAEKFDCFPYMNTYTSWATGYLKNSHFYADTPQLAIALAVIGSDK